MFNENRLQVVLENIPPYWV